MTFGYLCRLASVQVLLTFSSGSFTLQYKPVQVFFQVASKNPHAQHTFRFILFSNTSVSEFYIFSEMGGHITQRPWTPTKRRGPIAAEFAGPGPAWVHLPSMIGKASNPSATMHIRHSEPKAFVTPAPGAYCPEKAEKNLLDHSPKFSFGLKPKQENRSNTPAPNVYNVSSALANCPEGQKKKAPSYTMSGRGKNAVDPRLANPGPGKYDSSNLNLLKKKAPSYSLSVRTVLPSDDTKKPGPGAHSPEKVVTQVAPAHTFGIKHSPYANVK